MPSKTDDKYTHLELREPVKGQMKESEYKEGQGYTAIERKSVTDCTTHWDDPDYMADNAREFRKFREGGGRTKGTSTSQEDHGGKKRGRGANAGSPSKKTKNGGGGKQGEPTGAAGDKTRVPHEGQQVQWQAEGGYVGGRVVEVVYEEKDVEGHKVKGSKEDAQLVLRSDDGTICVQEPAAVYFD